MTYAGVQNLRIFLDGKTIINPYDKTDIFVLRRAPGNQHYDFVQEISFSESLNQETPIVLSVFEGEQSRGIAGFVIQVVIYSTWGDEYYCGMNGVKLFNERNEEIVLEEQSNYCTRVTSNSEFYTLF